jgi:hypothetical protein
MAGLRHGRDGGSLREFDPNRHYIIARDRETGQHIHVPLPELAGIELPAVDLTETHDKIRILAQANVALVQQLEHVLARLGDLEAHAIARVELK